MGMMAVEGVVENGRIRLRGDFALPEHAKVYVVVPDVAATPIRIRSPRLVRPEQAIELRKQVIDLPADGGQP